MDGFVAAAYGVVILLVGGYGISVWSRWRSAKQEAEALRGGRAESSVEYAGSCSESTWGDGNDDRSNQR